MTNLFTRLWKDESGQGMVEYGLILAAIAVVVIAALSGVGDKIKELFEGVDDELELPVGP